MNRLKKLFTRQRKQRRGVLTLEWILLVTVLVIGVIGGLGAVRNATLSELADLANAIEAINFKTLDECCSEEGALPGCVPASCP